MLEFILAIFLGVGLMVGAGGLFRSSWQRYQCANLAFEKAHQALLGAIEPDAGVTIREDSHEIVAVARCGKITERVGFLKLEAWK